MGVVSLTVVHSFFVTQAYRHAHVVAVYAAGGKKALREVLALTALPEVPIDPVECAHGGLHFGTCAKATATLVAKLHLVVGGSANFDAFFAYMSRRLGRPMKCNIYLREVTWPFGGKAGHMMHMMSNEVSAVMGYKPRLSAGESDPDDTISLVLDAIFAFSSIVGLVRNNRVAFAAFAPVAVAASVTANSLIALAFGRLYVSQRVNSEYLAHTIQRCYAASAVAGYTVTLEEELESKVEDLHRHVAKFWLACLRGGGKGSKAEIAARTMRFISRQWARYQFNFLEKSSLYTSLKMLRREEKNARRRSLSGRRRLEREVSESPPAGAFSAFWRAATGEPSVLSMLLAHAARAVEADRAVDKDGASSSSSSSSTSSTSSSSSSSSDSEDDADVEPGAEDPRATRCDGSAARDTDVDDNKAGAGAADDEDDGDGAAAAAAAADNDELLEPDDESLALFVPCSVDVVGVKLEVGSVTCLPEQTSGEWTILLRTAKSGASHELRIEMKPRSESGSPAMYRVKVDIVYGFRLWVEGNVEKLVVVLLEPVDHGTMNPKSKKFNLSKPGESDKGPFKAISAAATMVTVSAQDTYSVHEYALFCGFQRSSLRIIETREGKKLCFCVCRSQPNKGFRRCGTRSRSCATRPDTSRRERPPRSREWLRRASRRRAPTRRARTRSKRCPFRSRVSVRAFASKPSFFYAPSSCTPSTSTARAEKGARCGGSAWDVGDTSSSTTAGPMPLRERLQRMGLPTGTTNVSRK